ncbi:MAG: PadR family transcriptional regulator [Anaerolineae bacterium]|jgi:DNA-binding PadR family transcriptional regulator|nr:PadR family transcriptional regulator [Anaerolineae bacterium]
MSTRLVILGLLQDHPMYGYELKSIIEDHMADWTSIAFGSIYFALNKLSEERLIVKIATEQEGNRPSRAIYEITEEGKKEFMSLLRNQWAEVKQEHYAFDIALFFQEYLSTEEIVGMIGRKIKTLETAIHEVESHRGAILADAEVPRIATSIFDHSLVHMKAELGWLQSLKKRFPGG